MKTLLTAATLPVVCLCYYIYKKDNNKEPMDLLMKLLGFGIIIAIPVIIVELLLEGVCNTKDDLALISIFFKELIGVALVEEGFKWLVVKFKAYNSREFDEIYDIIVYSVFVSLGFACIENILYVFLGGLKVAFLRAFLSVPGHACFGVLMGYYLSRAKVASISGNKGLYIKNISLSLLMPMLFHAMYDALLTWYDNIVTVLEKSGSASIVKQASIINPRPIILLFLAFDVIMVIICFIIVNRTSKVQQNLNENLEAGSIVQNAGQIRLVETEAQTPAINFCPLCGTNVMTGHFCPHCGLRIR